MNRKFLLFRNAVVERFSKNLDYRNTKDYIDAYMDGEKSFAVLPLTPASVQIIEKGIEKASLIFERQAQTYGEMMFAPFRFETQALSVCYHNREQLETTGIDLTPFYCSDPKDYVLLDDSSGIETLKPEYRTDGAVLLVHNADGTIQIESPSPYQTGWLISTPLPFADIKDQSGNPIASQEELDHSKSTIGNLTIFLFVDSEKYQQGWLCTKKEYQEIYRLLLEQSFTLNERIPYMLDHPETGLYIMLLFAEEDLCKAGNVVESIQLAVQEAREKEGDNVDPGNLEMAGWRDNFSDY